MKRYLHPNGHCSTIKNNQDMEVIEMSINKSLQSCLTLCDPMNCSPPGSSVHRILHARILEWVAIPSSTGSSRPGDRIHVSYISCTGRQILLLKPLVSPGKPIYMCVCVQLLNFFQLFCNPMDCSLPGSFVHGILQARILE